MPYNNHINNRYKFTRFENQSTTFVFNTCEYWFLFSIVCPQSLKSLFVQYSLSLKLCNSPLYISNAYNCWKFYTYIYI